MKTIIKDARRTFSPRWVVLRLFATATSAVSTPRNGETLRLTNLYANALRCCRYPVGKLPSAS